MNTNDMSKNILMIGDSITEGFKIRSIFPKYKVKNVGVSGDSTLETLERINERWFVPKPSIVFICIGTNDLARSRTDEEILENIKKIVKELGKSIEFQKIFLISIFPTKDNKPRPNERINSFNTKLELLTKKIGVHYFNLRPHFVDEFGKLKSEYTDDGLHLTNLGYIKWEEILNKFLTNQ